MAIQNINSVARVQSMATKAAPPNPLGVEWVTGPATNSGLQVDWRQAATPQAPAPAPAPAPNPTPGPLPAPINYRFETDHIRVATPLIAKVGNWIADRVGLGAGGAAPVDPALGGIGADPGLIGGDPGFIGGDPMIGDPGLGGALPSDPIAIDPGMGDPSMVDPTDFSGGTMGNVSSRISGGVGRVFDSLREAANAGFQAAKGALKRNFIFAGITSALSNGISYFTGKATGKQAVSGFVADTGAYTAIGSASTFAGAALGTLIPIPFVGTAIGIAAGMGLGYLYEKFVRRDLVKKVEGVVDNLSGAIGQNAFTQGKGALDKISL